MLNTCTAVLYRERDYCDKVPLVLDEYRCQAKTISIVQTHRNAPRMKISDQLSADICLWTIGILVKNYIGATLLKSVMSYLSWIWLYSCVLAGERRNMEVLVDHTGSACKYMYLKTLICIDDFQMSIKRPTSWGQTRDQHSQVTFHLERSSFFYLSVLMVRTWCTSAY